MQTRHIVTRATFSAALLSAFVLVQPAYAGLLGGGVGGAIGGRFVGGLAGNFGNRSLDAGGSAAGNARHEVSLPRPDKKAVDTAHGAAMKTASTQHSIMGQAGVTGRAAATATAEKVTESQSRAGTSMANGGDSATTVAGSSSSAGGASGAAAGTQGTSVDLTKHASAMARRGSGEARVTGAGQVSRGDRSVSASDSAQGSMRH